MNTTETKINFLFVIHVEASHRFLGANRLIRFTFCHPPLTEFILQPASHTHTSAPWRLQNRKDGEGRTAHATRKITPYLLRVQFVTRQ